MHDMHVSTLQSHQRELAIRIKQFVEEHESTADSYSVQATRRNTN